MHACRLPWYNRVGIIIECVYMCYIYMWLHIWLYIYVCALVCVCVCVKPEWLGNFFLKIAAHFFILTR